MAIKVADNFSYKGGKPLDERTKYASVADMVAVPVADLYDGCLAYVTATKKNYQYDSTNDTDPTLGKWRELQTGGGGGASSFSDLDDVSLSNLQNGQVPKYNSQTHKWENVDDSTEEYTAGDGIEIDNNNVVSVDEMASADMEEILDPLPSVMSRRFKHSTEEQIVGTWIDGRPVYEKTVVKTINTYVDGGQSNSRRSFTLEKSDIDNNLDIILGCNGYITDIVGTGGGRPSYIAIPSATFYGFSSYANVNYSAFAGKDTVGVSMTTSYAITSLKMTVTLQYTKTTE